MVEDDEELPPPPDSPSLRGTGPGLDSLHGGHVSATTTATMYQLLIMADTRNAKEEARNGKNENLDTAGAGTAQPPSMPGQQQPQGVPQTTAVPISIPVPFPGAAQVSPAAGSRRRRE